MTVSAIDDYRLSKSTKASMVDDTNPPKIVARVSLMTPIPLLVIKQYGTDGQCSEGERVRAYKSSERQRYTTMNVYFFYRGKEDVWELPHLFMASRVSNLSFSS